MTSILTALLVSGCTRATPKKFEDDFSSRASGWPTGATERGDEWGYVDGKYRMFIKVRAGQVAAGQIAGIPLAKQGKRLHALTVEADTVQQTGPPVTLHGVSCGTSPAEVYFFLINLDGYYFIVRDDAETASADLLRSGRISVPIRGIGQINRIRAECVGGEQEAMLTLSVNGEKVAEVQGQRGETFDRAAFVVTTLYAIAGSTRAAVPGVSKERPGSRTAFEAEILFDNFVARVPWRANGNRSTVALMGEARRPKLTPAINPTERMEFYGFSILPPRGKKWFFATNVPAQFGEKHGTWSVIFFKKVGKLRSIYAAVWVADLGDPTDPTAKSRTESLQSLASDFLEETKRDPRFKPLDTKASLDKCLGYDCVRFKVVAEDHSPRDVPGSILILTREGFIVPHPHSPAFFIWVEYSQRFPPGKKPFPVEAELEPFLASLEFTPPQ
jgi:hypothetical protein